MSKIVNNEIKLIIVKYYITNKRFDYGLELHFISFLINFR